LKLEKMIRKVNMKFYRSILKKKIKFIISLIGLVVIKDIIGKMR